MRSACVSKQFLQFLFPKLTEGHVSGSEDRLINGWVTYHIQETSNFLCSDQYVELTVHDNCTNRIDILLVVRGLALLLMSSALARDPSSRCSSSGHMSVVEKNA